MNKSTAEKKYDTYIQQIREGHISFEPAAIDLARKYDFPLDVLMDALRTGKQKMFDAYICFINNGDISFLSEARKLAGSNEDLIDRVEDAWRNGTRVIAERRSRTVDDRCRNADYSAISNIIL